MKRARCYAPHPRADLPEHPWECNLRHNHRGPHEAWHSDNRVRREKHGPACTWPQNGVAFGYHPAARVDTVVVFVCDRCGSVRVQAMDWLDANTNAFVGGAQPSSSMGEVYCENCGSHPPLSDKRVLPSRAAMLLRARQREVAEEVVNALHDVEAALSGLRERGLTRTPETKALSRARAALRDAGARTRN